MMSLRSASCCALLLLAGCSTPAPETGTGDYQVTMVSPEVLGALQAEEYRVDGSAASSTATQYKLGAGDVLLYRIYTAPGIDGTTGMREGVLASIEQTNTIAVQGDGTVNMPYAGTLHFAGETVPAATEKARIALSQYFKKPQVSLEVKEFNSRKVFVMGEVMKPTFQILKTGRTTIAELIAASQGLNPQTAQYKQIYVIRGVMDSQALPGSVAQASPMKTTIYQLDASNATGMAMTAQFPLKADDVIYVSPTVISEWNKVINQLLPFSLSNAANVSRQY